MADKQDTSTERGRSEAWEITTGRHVCVEAARGVQGCMATIHNSRPSAFPCGHWSTHHTLHTHHTNDHGRKGRTHGGPDKMPGPGHNCAVVHARTMPSLVIRSSTLDSARCMHTHMCQGFDTKMCTAASGRHGQGSRSETADSCKTSAACTYSRTRCDPDGLASSPPSGTNPSVQDRVTFHISRSLLSFSTGGGEIEGQIYTIDT